MDVSLVSLSQMLSASQLFDIPVYQRSYAWEAKNLEDLWEDIYYLDPAKQHYFGTVLLKDSGTIAETALANLKRFDVIDGQQRLTTVLILLREIISQLRLIGQSEHQDELAMLEKTYIKNGPYYKLNLQTNDGEFFRHVILENNEDFLDDTITQSQRRLANAKRFFKDRLTNEQARDPSNFRDFLIQLKKKLDDLQIMQYQVNSNADAIRIFDTVNDRGRPLSNLEKTKSFLMHISYLGIQGER